VRKLAAFMQMTLNGYFAGANGDVRWAHREDAEFQDFVKGNAKGGGNLLMGRLTYDMMVSWWPTPMAAKVDPVVTERMNSLPKVVFSRTLNATSWNNTTLVKGDLATEVRKLKSAPGDDMVILGSGSIVAQLAQAGLIDEYQIVLNPVALGNGKTLFEGISDQLNLKLVKSRVFGNGNVFLCYEPLA
jgi:dihydrofolate reductase